MEEGQWRRKTWRLKSTKKVETQEERIDGKALEDYGPIEMEEVLIEQVSDIMVEEDVQMIQGLPKRLYRDSLLTNGSGKDLSYEDIVNIITREYMTADSLEVLLEEPPPFNPKPNVEVSLEEYDEWCKPWKFSLIVKLLGKKFRFHAMANWIRQAWAKGWDVKILDLTNEFFLI